MLHPYKFYGRDMSGILFFIFASCHPLKAFSWETDLWVTPGDFMVENAKLEREISIELKIDQVETKPGVV